MYLYSLWFNSGAAFSSAFDHQSVRNYQDISKHALICLTSSVVWLQHSDTCRAKTELFQNRETPGN